MMMTRDDDVKVVEMSVIDRERTACALRFPLPVAPPLEFDRRVRLVVEGFERLYET